MVLNRKLWKAKKQLDERYAERFSSLLRWVQEGDQKVTALKAEVAAQAIIIGSYQDRVSMLHKEISERDTKIAKLQELLDLYRVTFALPEERGALVEEE